MKPSARVDIRVIYCGDKIEGCQWKIGILVKPNMLEAHVSDIRLPVGRGPRLLARRLIAHPGTVRQKLTGAFRCQRRLKCLPLRVRFQRSVVHRLLDREFHRALDLLVVSSFVMTMSASMGL